jgi:putative phosphonate metabolism protein
VSDRYAIYFAPEPKTALWRTGSAWLGRDAATGRLLAPALPPDLERRRWQAITGAPRRYGFHATLKPPFRLAPGLTAATLLEACAAFAARRPALIAPPLTIVEIDGFLALAFAEPSAAVNRLAADAVAAFDDFRAPPGAAESARRRAAGLSPRQAALLRRWGYPYVLEEFRFHMTLTERLDSAERALLRRWLTTVFRSATRRPTPVEAVSLFYQPAASAPFAMVRRFRFRAAAPTTSVTVARRAVAQAS